jgi:hypothetical protein
MSIRYVASSVSEEEQSLTDIVANGTGRPSVRLSNFGGASL